MATFVSKETFLFICVELHSIYRVPIYQLSYIGYPIITNFTQTENHDPNYLLLPSLPSIIVYVYFLGKRFVVRIVLRKTFQQKNVPTTCKNMEKNLSDLSTI